MTKIYQVLEYTSVQCFRKLGEQISDVRRAGDAELKQRYQSEKHNWFPRSNIPEYAHMIRKHRGSSKKNTEMELLPYVVKHIIVVRSRINSAANESIND